MLRSWLTSQTGYFSPLEWTLQAWALFAGDVRGSSPIDALEAYLRRATRGQVSTEVASQLGAVLIARGQPALTYRDMEKAIASKRVTYDFARLMDSATQVSCSGFGEVMIEHM